MAGTARDKDERLAQARRLVAALEQNDSHGEAAASREILAAEMFAWHADLTRITDDLRDTLCSHRVTSELSRLAHRELPEAKLSLGHVLELTEDAAHKTLSAVEAAMPVAASIVASVRAFAREWPPGDVRTSRDAALHGLFSRLEHEGGSLKARLSEVLMAQGFQDLSGQIIRRVAELVGELEAHLSQVRSESGGADDRASDLRRGTGTAVPGIADEQRVTGQQDVDDLLSELGV